MLVLCGFSSCYFCFTMEYVKDLRWRKGMNVKDLVSSMGKVGYQSIELKRASDVIVKMKKNNAKVFFDFYL